MSDATQAVLLDAVPLFVLAAVYAAAALLVALRRDRALAALPVAVAAAATILGVLVAVDGAPLAGDAWASFAAILVALVPGAAVVLRPPARAPAPDASLRDRELAAVAAISNALVRAADPKAIGRVVADEVAALLGVEFVALALVDEGGEGATGLVARRDGADLEWWADQQVDLRDEPSGIASALFDGAAFQVYDCAASTRVSARLARLVDAKSGAWIPMAAGDRAVGVLVIATTGEHRSFTAEELDVLQAIASEAGLALDRRRSVEALSLALERERLVAEVSRKVRSELDVESLMRVAVAETARALGGARCFVRLVEPDGLRMAAEWHEPSLAPIGELDALPVSNLAARERRTVAVGDVAAAAELDDEAPRGREALLSIGSRAAVAVPLLVFDRLQGTLALHRADAGDWSDGDVLALEAVTREVALALRTAQLLDENRRRLEQQGALLHAAQVLTSELDPGTVLARLVEEAARLLQADAADCYLLDAAGGTLRCAAVHGLDPSLVGFEFPRDTGVAGRAIASGAPVHSHEYELSPGRVPAAAYDGFDDALVAPIVWGDEVRGVLGAGLRAGGRRFGDDDAELLGTLAVLAALALRNAESFGERSQQARIQQGFYRIAEVLGEPLSLAQTVPAIAQAAAEALGGDAAAVLTPGPEGLELAGAYELPEALERALAGGLPESADALRLAATERRVLASSRLDADDRFGEAWRALAAEAGAGALLAIPIDPARGEEAATAIVFFRGEHRIADDDLDLARQVARAASGALERAELYEAERSSRALAQQLARTGSLLATELDPVAVLEEVVEQAAVLLEGDAASIRSLERDELVVTAGYGDGAEDAVGDRAASTAWPAGDVVHARAPVAVGDVARTGRSPEGEPVLADGLAAYLGVPLYGREGALHGVLAVYARRPRAWREEEVEALAALAANASVALSNAELYQRVALEREQSVAILANIADGIVAVDRDGRIVLWNAAAAQIAGVPREEALGRTPAQVLQRELETEGTGPGGSRLVSISRGGEEIWLSLSEAVMRDPVGAVAGRIFAFRDISGERLVEEMKSDFVSTVSHELRTPLTSIYGFAETLLRQDISFGEEERRTFLGYIARESERLTSIVDALLNVARLDTGDLQVHMAPTDVSQVVAEAVSTARSAAEGNGHSFVVDLDDGPFEADADAEKLRQILDQLIQNAVKFSPGGATVTVAARRGADAVQVSVVDEGAGIPQAERQRIFTKFYRGAAGEQTTGGAGLGLFIAHGLVTAMGGRIWVDSAEGRGSAFTFELPATREGE